MIKCPKCNHKYARFPIRDEQGNIIVKNLFKMDLVSILLLITVITMIVGYNIDTQTCHEIVESGCDFCKDNNCCDILKIEAAQGSYSTPTISSEPIEIPNLFPK